MNGTSRNAIDPVVPFSYRPLGVEATCAEIRRINAQTGLRRFLLTAPGFNDVMFGPFPDDLYAKIGEDIAAVKRGLADTDIEISWWCTPSIRYFSDYTPVEDAEGNKILDNRKCPLDERFAADFAAKVQAVAKAHPAMICFEDDYTLSAGRGLGKSGACFCPLHLAAFAKRYGKAIAKAPLPRISKGKGEVPVEMECPFTPPEGAVWVRVWIYDGTIEYIRITDNGN